MLRNLLVRLKDLASLEEAALSLLHRRGVNLMFHAHVLVLRTPLLEGPQAAGDGACKWLFTSVRPDMVLERVFRLASSATDIALMRSLTWSVLLR